MTSQALYNRWRSQTFDDVLGQEHITATLRNQIKAGRIGHAYLFTGLRGTGKTSTARIMAKAVNCVGDTDDPPCNVCHMCTSITEGRSLDLMEIDAASNRGIDEIRELRERVSFVPHEARYKVYVIDEVHMLTKEASNALLKTLEEPPPHVIFILCTTEPHRLLDTILSRCQRFDFRRASVPVILTKLQQICAGEGMEVDSAALEYIARRAAGSFRDAESLLEHVAAYTSGTVELELVQHLLGAAPAELVTDLIASMLAGDAGSGLRLVNQALDQGADPRQFIGEVLDQLRGLLLISVGSDDALAYLGPGTVESLHQLTRVPGFSAQFLVQAIRSFNESAQGLRTAIRTQLPLELAVVETIIACRSGNTALKVSAEGAPPAASGTSRETATAATRPQRSVEPPEKQPTVLSAQEGIAKAIDRADHSLDAVVEQAPAAVEAVADGGVHQVSDAVTLDSAPKAAPVAPAVSAVIERGPADAEPDSGQSDTASPGGITLEWVQGKWSQIMSRMGAADRSVQAFLRSTYPIRVNGDVVVLGCESTFHRDRLSETKRSVLVEQIMSEVLEAPCRLQCVVDKAEIERMRAAAPPDENLFSRVDRRMQREQELLNHPAVKALEQRGGHVTRVELSEDESQ